MSRWCLHRGRASRQAAPGRERGSRRSGSPHATCGDGLVGRAPAPVGRARITCGVTTMSMSHAGPSAAAGPFVTVADPVAPGSREVPTAVDDARRHVHGMVRPPRSGRATGRREVARRDDGAARRWVRCSRGPVPGPAWRGRRRAGSGGGQAAGAGPSTQVGDRIEREASVSPLRWEASVVALGKGRRIRCLSLLGPPTSRDVHPRRAQLATTTRPGHGVPRGGRLGPGRRGPPLPLTSLLPTPPLNFGHRHPDPGGGRARPGWDPPHASPAGPSTTTCRPCSAPSLAAPCRVDMVLPMNPAPKPETAPKVARRCGATRSRAPDEHASVVAAAATPRPHHQHHQPPEDHLAKTHYGPYTPGFPPGPARRRGCLEAVIDDNDGGCPRRADPGRGRRRPASRRLPGRRPSALQPPRDPRGRRRGAVRPGPHRCGSRATSRRRARHLHPREGAGRRHPAAVGGRRDADVLGVLIPGEPRQHLRRQTRSPWPWDARCSACSRPASRRRGRGTSSPSSRTASPRCSATGWSACGSGVVGGARPRPGAGHRARPLRGPRPAGRARQGDTHGSTIRVSPPLTIERSDLGGARSGPRRRRRSGERSPAALLTARAGPGPRSRSSRGPSALQHQLNTF